MILFERLAVFSNEELCVCVGVFQMLPYVNLLGPLGDCVSLPCHMCSNQQVLELLNFQVFLVMLPLRHQSLDSNTRSDG